MGRHFTIPAMLAALTIAGSDPTGAAGLQADVQVFRALGVHGCGVLTAITVQDSRKVHQVLPVFPTVVLEQLRALLRDFRPGAIKTGALASDDVARNVALGLEEVDRDVPLVIDPVLAASDGTPLLERRAFAVLQAMIGRAALVTPNLPEAEALSGRDVSTREGTEDAARAFVEEFGAGAALVKGGHREGSPDDLLALRDAAGVRLVWLEGKRIEGEPVRGTGCALSAAICAALALGDPLERAVARGRAFVADGIRAARSPGEASGRFLVHP